MSEKTWTITDTAANVHHDQFRLTSADMPGLGDGWSVTRLTLRGGLRDGVDLIELDNGRMRLLILPTRGMGIWRAELDTGETLGWKSPVHGPVHPKFVPLTEPSGLGWLEGFDEHLVRCGLESNGEPVFDENGRLRYPLHGRIANRPAQRVDVILDESAGTITVRGIVEETRFLFQKLRLTASISTKLGSTSYALEDQVENASAAPAGMQMLYHVNFGEPMVGEGAKLIAPVREVAPHDASATAAYESWQNYGPPIDGAPEQVFFFELLSDSNNETQAMVKTANGKSGAAVRFNTDQLPCFTLWKNMVASVDGYATGLEPATNFPNARPFEQEQGRVVELAAGGSWSGRVEVDWLTTADEVQATEEAVRVLQGEVAPVVQSQPKTGWNP